MTPIFWRRMHSFVLSLACATFGMAMNIEFPANGNEKSQLVLRDFSWVPPDAESIAMSKGPFQLGKDGSGKHMRDGFRELSVGPVTFDDASWFSEVVLAQEFLFAATFMKNFRQTDETEGIPSYFIKSDDASILFVESDKGDAWGEVRGTILRHARNLIGPYPNELVRVTFDPERYRNRDLYIGMPKPGVIVYGNDAEFVGAVMGKLPNLSIHGHMGSSILNDESWGAIRRYRKSELDPYSPLSKVACWKDKNAVGFTLSPSGENNVEFLYYSEHGSAPVDFFKGQQVLVTFTQNGGKTDYILGSDSNPNGLFMFLMNLIGKTVCIP